MHLKLKITDDNRKKIKRKQLKTMTQKSQNTKFEVKKNYRVRTLFVFLVLRSSTTLDIFEKKYPKNQ